MFSTQTEGLDGQNEEFDHEGEDETKIIHAKTESF